MRPTESQTAADGCCASTGPAPTATTLRNRVAFTTFFMDGLLRFVVAAYNACFRSKPTTPDAAISAGSGTRFIVTMTAGASRNWRSVSQRNCSTTPPWRNGTIASPLPNTNSPAAAKYQNTFQSTPTDTAPVRPDVSHAGHGATSSALVGIAGRARARESRGTNPDATNTQMISVAVQAVTMRLTANSPHSSGSCPSVARASFAALRAMIAITAAPTP